VISAPRVRGKSAQAASPKIHIMRRLTELEFDNTYARLPAAFHVRMRPEPFADPFLVSFNPEAARLIGLDAEEALRPEFVEYIGGRKTLEGSDSVAMIYAGHQFGQYLPQLGDGRSLLLGEVVNGAGERWHLHLKGAGPTPFARGYDGRAVLRSAIREYLCGEAMHGLGIPTERGLCIIGGDEVVKRRIVTEEVTETVAMLLRLAPSFVRFGSFEVFHYRGQHEHVTRLADYVIEQHFPDMKGAGNKYRELLRRVVVSTAELVARWQAFGFVHGAVNTDNMSILGFTLDYGPFCFLDEFKMEFVSDPHIDRAGRFAFDRQPGVALWNLYCFARTLLHLLPKEEVTETLDLFDPTFDEHYGALMSEKLGFAEHHPGDAEILSHLLKILEANRVDYSIFFRELGGVEQDSPRESSALRHAFANPAEFDDWAARYRRRLLAENSNDRERQRRMNRVNPKYILRTYMTHRAVNAAQQGDYSEVRCLLNLLRDPYAEQSEMQRYAEPPPDWAKDLRVTVAS
jgi:uncharacterized protein YdiU (UPF0061 family)